VLPVRLPALAATVLCLGAGTAWAQTDEIQVYDASIEAPGQASLTLHNNDTPDGRTTPAFPGGLIANHTENGVFEWALGVKPWWELGLYFPLYSFTNDGKVLYDGFKLRSEFVSPNARDRTFFYGVNFEFSVNTAHWDASRISGEIRPIAGVHLGPWDLIANPILDTEFNGIHALTFAPAERVMYNFSPSWALGAEHYGEYGALSALQSPVHGGNTLFGVGDFTAKSFSAEFGAGWGVSGHADRLVLKLILTTGF